MSEKFRLQHNETILLLHYFKFIRQCDETGDEWMGRLREEAAE